MSLNLGNNNMDEKCGELFEEATRFNDTLIDFEFGFNNFALNDVSITIDLQSTLLFIVLYYIIRVINMHFIGA